MQNLFDNPGKKQTCLILLYYVDQFEASISPLDNPWVFDHFPCLGGGEFEHCLAGVGKLNNSFQWN